MDEPRSHQRAMIANATVKDPFPSVFDRLQEHHVEVEKEAREQRGRTLALLQKRLDSCSKDPTTYIEFARYYTRVHEHEAAISVLRKGLTACQPNEQLYAEAVFALEEANRTDEAILLANHARTLFPDHRYFELWEALMLPVLYDTQEQIEQYRSRYSTALKALCEGVDLNTREHCRAALEAVRQHLNFYLGYQGQNDRELQEQYGQFLHRILAANFPEWARSLDMPPVLPGGRIRVGYISAHFRDHSVSKLFLGWLRQHDSQRFELFVYHNGRTVDAVTEEVRRISDHFRHMPGVVEPLCRAVLADDLHVVVFLDVRHRRMALLSALRLAPVQCVAWAYPVTSGSPTIDYYLSGELMEPDGAQDHYSERLVLLPGIGVHFPKPTIPRFMLRKSRHDFGLGAERVVFLSSQMTFKYLPNNDHLFAAIAKRVPHSQFVFLALNDMVAKDFRARVGRAFAAEGLEVDDYCVILPQLSQYDYWNLNLVSDVFLDSLEWSGGVTTLEAIACGLPIVTLPGRFMRGRHSYGILWQLGVTETIARNKQEYIDIAVRLGLDREWRGAVLDHMRSNEGRLYSDRQCIRALEDFFHSAVSERLS
jgi:protein O-GlcNAc transferase